MPLPYLYQFRLKTAFPISRRLYLYRAMSTLECFFVFPIPTVTGIITWSSPNFVDTPNIDYFHVFSQIHP